MSIEQEFIEQINADPSDRMLQLVYADWLDDQCDPKAEAWRVLIEAGKQPQRDHRGRWRWWYSAPPVGYESATVKDVLPGTVIMTVDCPLRLCRNYFEAMDMLAAEWVRHHREQPLHPLQSARDIHAEAEAMATAIRMGLTASALPPAVILTRPYE